jgi:DNA primase
MAKLDNPSISPILEYYGATVPSRMGWASMRCPFHDDTHKSASVSKDINVFCCFACQIKGNGYTIIMTKEGVGFREAINIAERILDASGEVLQHGSGRSGSLLKGTRNKSRSSTYSTLGRRLRPSDGS